MSELSKIIISTILEPNSEKTPKQIMSEFEQEMQDVIDYIKEWKHNKLKFIEENNKNVSPDCTRESEVYECSDTLEPLFDVEEFVCYYRYNCGNGTYGTGGARTLKSFEKFKNSIYKPTGKPYSEYITEVKMNKPQEGVITDQEIINCIKTGEENIGLNIFHNFFRILLMDKIYPRFKHISDCTKFWDDFENIACEYIRSIYPNL